MITSPPVNHVFVDFENVHEIDPAVIGMQAVTFTFLLGPGKKKLDTALVEKLLEHAGTARFVRLTALGPNAVDFALAYYVGQAVLTDPVGHFHIISGDKGYDPLIEHLKSRDVHIQRHADFASFVGRVLYTPAPAAVASAGENGRQAPTLSAGAVQLLEKLASFASRPRNRKALTHHAVTVLGNKITEEQATRLIAELCFFQKLAINAQDKVEYRFLAPPVA